MKPSSVALHQNHAIYSIHRKVDGRNVVFSEEHVVIRTRLPN